ncbi:MAG: hypothetical protein IJ973_00990, partial [Christensenellaceae bacterium]|nr:hypothetical protein [Christensenellaceae bacterium]
MKRIISLMFAMLLMFGFSCGKTEPAESPVPSEIAESLPTKTPESTPEPTPTPEPVLAPNAGIELYKEGKKEEAMEAWAKIADRNVMGSGMAFTAALLADGTVKGVGSNEIGQLNFEDWTDIIAISAGQCHTAGLKADGTVVISTPVGSMTGYGHDKVEDWYDIVSVDAGHCYTVGLKA